MVWRRFGSGRQCLNRMQDGRHQPV
ncbi:hypothetical protein FLAG1_11922, partial [Fusarium langsethiae]